MVSLKCGICILLSIISLTEMRQTATTTPELKNLKLEEPSSPVDTSMLRSGPEHYDMYQFGDLTGLPIPDVSKTIMIDHQPPKRYSTLDDTLIDYEDDLLLDSPILDPILESALYKPPFDIPRFGSYIVDAGAYMRAPLIKAPLIKPPLIKRPWIKKQVFQSIQTPLVPTPMKKNQQASLQEIETILKTLLPLFKSATVPMRARLQIGRQGEEIIK